MVLPSTSPVAQAQSAMHGFIEMTGDHLGTPPTSRTIYIAALPYTSVPKDWAMAGVPRSLILDKDDVAADLRLAERLRAAILTEARGASALAPEYAARLERFVGAKLEVNDSDASISPESEDAQDALTEKQAVLLGATRSLKHVRFIGGAGNGKTWLAVEKAKRLCREGERVGLFCYNKGLGMHLKRRVDKWRQRKPEFTGEFHEYALAMGVPAGEGQDYYDREMPRQLAEIGKQLRPDEKFDAIVVDEAQDFAPEWWDALLACVNNPSEAIVYAFMDGQQDVYRRWDGQGTVGANGSGIQLEPIHVDDNLRNTRKIAETFRCFTGERFTPRTSTGLPVRIVPCSTAEALDYASDCVDALIAEG